MKGNNSGIYAERYRRSESNKISILIFLSLLFTGFAFGILFRFDVVGMFLGLGAGFFAVAVLKIKDKSKFKINAKTAKYFAVSDYEDFSIGAFFSILFIFFGLLLIHFKLYSHQISFGFLVLLELIKFIIGLFLIFIGIMSFASAVLYFFKLKHNIKKSKS
ncbi:MAG: hypothetical protein M1331_03335 [Candidatus Marsarchaeota archaeon]|nr:hypothetical protein [Candidatus Marsarchaeota archaeon]